MNTKYATKDYYLKYRNDFMKRNIEIVTIEFIYKKNKLEQIWVLCPSAGVLYATFINSYTTINQAEIIISNMIKTASYKKIYKYNE